MDFVYFPKQTIKLEDYYQQLSQLNCPKEVEMAPSPLSDVIQQEPHPLDPLPSSTTKEKELKKKKFVPWEPYKAAPSSDRKGGKPDQLPDKLIPYRTNSEDCDQTPLIETRLIDERRLRLQKEESVQETERIRQLEKELEKAREQIGVEEKLNIELKRLLIATVDDDLQCHLNALSEDKVRLASTLNEYANKLNSDDDQIDSLRIERDVWRCKFLAMSIRSDELTKRNEALLGLLRCGQSCLRQLLPSTTLPSPLHEHISSFLNISLSSLYQRSPCEEKYAPDGPKYHNLTISCCKNCAGKEIQLL